MGVPQISDELLFTCVRPLFSVGVLSCFSHDHPLVPSSVVVSEGPPPLYPFSFWNFRVILNLHVSLTTFTLSPSPLG